MGMSDQTHDRTRRGYGVIDQAALVDVTSYDSFPASDPPSWIATGIGSPHLDESADNDSTRAPPGASNVAPDIDNTVWDIELESPRMSPVYNAPLYLIPFDHRCCYVAGMFRFTLPLTTEQHGAVVDRKHVISDGFQRALDNEVPVAGAFAKHIEAFQPGFARILLRYNLEDAAALTKRQTLRLKQLSDYCRAVGQPFMFELLVPAMIAQSDRVRADERVYDRRIQPRLTVEAVCVDRKSVV